MRIVHFLPSREWDSECEQAHVLARVHMHKQERESAIVLHFYIDT